MVRGGLGSRCAFTASKRVRCQDHRAFAVEWRLHTRTLFALHTRSSDHCAFCGFSAFNDALLVTAVEADPTTFIHTEAEEAKADDSAEVWLRFRYDVRLLCSFDCTTGCFQNDIGPELSFLQLTMIDPRIVLTAFARVYRYFRFRYMESGVTRIREHFLTKSIMKTRKLPYCLRCGTIVLLVRNGYREVECREPSFNASSKTSK